MAYTAGGATTIATWSAGAPAPTLAPLPGPALTIGGFAVNAAGDAVLAGLAGSPAELTVAYRQGPTGAFALRTYPYGPASIPVAVTSARVAINAVGHGGGDLPGRRAARDHAHGDGRLADDARGGRTARSTTVTDADLPVGIDTTGNAYAAFTYTVAGPATVLRTALRPATGGWQQSGDLSSATAMSAASSVGVHVAPSGTAALVWVQAAGAVASVKARYGATSANMWGATEDVNDADAITPTAAHRGRRHRGGGLGALDDGRQRRTGARARAGGGGRLG